MGSDLTEQREDLRSGKNTQNNCIKKTRTQISWWCDQYLEPDTRQALEAHEQRVMEEELLNPERCCESAHSAMPANSENQQCTQTGKSSVIAWVTHVSRSSFDHLSSLSSHASIAQNFPRPGASAVWAVKFWRPGGVLEKRENSRHKLANIRWIMKAKRVPEKTSILVDWPCQSLIVWSQMWKFPERRWGYCWLAWETCQEATKPESRHGTTDWKQIEKEYMFTACLSLYAESTSQKHWAGRAGIRQLGKYHNLICRMTIHFLWQKVKRKAFLFDESEKREFKAHH